MPDANREILNDAIARNCAVVLSLPSAGILRHQKSRFLSEVADGIWVEAGANEFALIDELITTQKPAGISFKSGQTKVVFASPILAVNREYRMNSETVLPAVRIAVPAQIKAIQRRSNYRVRAFTDCELAARIWRIAPRVYIGDRPMASQEVKVTLRDLSVGGMGVMLHGEDGKPPKITTEDRLRVELRHRDAVLLIEARMRNPAGPQPPGALNTGIQFNDMGADIEGRQKVAQLTRIVGEMQREEVRKARLGIA
jgi:c-di-GMP-binding flagellar brake protein YcgR